MQFAVLSRPIYSREETIEKFPSYEEARDFASASENEVREVVILRDDRVFFLEETVSEDEYCNEDRPLWFCYSREDWLEALKEFIPILCVPRVNLVAVNCFIGEWLTEDFADYEAPQAWEIASTEVSRFSVKVGFFDRYSGNNTCSATFLLHIPTVE